MASGVTVARGQSTETDVADSPSMKHIGKLYNRLDATQAREQPSLAEEIIDIYSKYVKAKDRFQKTPTFSIRWMSRSCTSGSANAKFLACGTIGLFPNGKLGFPEKYRARVRLGAVRLMVSRGI